ATMTAAAMNGLAAVMALAVASFDRQPRDEKPDAPLDQAAATSASDEQNAVIYIAIACSGFCAMGAQAIWTRLLGLLFGASVYGFAIILAVFLVGLGIGSWLGSHICRNVERPRLALGWCQLAAAAAIAWTAYALAASLPYWPVNPSISSSIW